VLEQDDEICRGKREKAQAKRSSATAAEEREREREREREWKSCCEGEQGERKNGKETGRQSK